MPEKQNLHIDPGLSVPEVLTSALGLVGKIAQSYWPDRKITVAELRDCAAWFLRDLAGKANPEAATILEFLADLLDEE